MTRLRSSLVATLALASLALSTGTAMADPAASAGVPTVESDAVLSYGFTSDSTPQDILVSIEAANSAEEIAAYADGLEALSDPTPQQADLLSILSDEPLASARSLADAPKKGGPVNSGFNWRNTFDMGWKECPFLKPCYDKWKITTTITTEPGEFGSKSSLKFLNQGTGVPSVSISSVVYGSGSSVSDVSNVWSPVGAATQWNSPHRGLLGKTFQAKYVVSTPTPGGVLSVEYKTNLSNSCKKPTGKPFRCIFAP